MNIFAIKGHKVKVRENSYCIKDVLKILELDKIYLIDHTEVLSSSTYVYLQGFNQSFNSVNFKEIEPQSLVDDVKHPSYFYYCDSERKEHILNKVNKMLREDKLKRILK